MPLQPISSIVYEMQTEKIQRRNQFRTITVSAFSAAGALPSEVLDAALPQLEAFARAAFPPATAGDRRRTRGAGQGLRGPGGRAADLGRAIYLALVFQFKNAIKPLDRLRGDSLRHRRRAGGALDHGHRRSASWPSSASSA